MVTSGGPDFWADTNVLLMHHLWDGERGLRPEVNQVCLLSSSSPPSLSSVLLLLLPGMIYIARSTQQQERERSKPVLAFLPFSAFPHLLLSLCSSHYSSPSLPLHCLQVRDTTMSDRYGSLVRNKVTQRYINYVMTMTEQQQQQQQQQQNHLPSTTRSKK